MTIVRLVPLRLASPREVERSVLSVHDALNDVAGTLVNWLTRHQEVLSGVKNFSGVCILLDNEGGAGWSGWLPYRDAPHTWQSSVYIAPRLRGTGVFPRLICDQAHRATPLAVSLGSRPSFVTSIDILNLRSLSAHQRVLPDSWAAWQLRCEASTGREAWVAEWPAPPALHECFLPEGDNVGLESLRSIVI